MLNYTDKLESLDDLYLKPRFLLRKTFPDIYKNVKNEVKPFLKQGVISMRGRTLLEPRIKAFFSISGTEDYSYGTETSITNKFTPTLEKLRLYIKRKTRVEYNCCLVNMYRNGQDSISWHGDNENSLKYQSPIATISLGGERDFQLRECNNVTNKRTIRFQNRDLLIMPGGECNFQRMYQHCIPKRRNMNHPRISLTFRILASNENITRLGKVNKDDYDIFIGRGGKWGNPYKIPSDGDRDEVIEKYEKYIRKNKTLLADIEELRGKKLGCFCYPLSCHGDVLIKLLKERE